MAFYRDEGKLRSFDVRWALESFNCGIKEYFDDTFRQFHADLYQNIVHIRGRCCQKCSKKKQVADWCSLCSKWRDAILAKHKSRNSMMGTFNWKNIDSTKWPSDVEEVQKVFLPSWYKGKLDTTDLSSCLSIMANCTLFNNRKKLLAIKDIRNHVSHGGMSITVTEKQEYIGKILSFLKKDNLKTFPSVRKAIKHVALLETQSVKDIYENDLIEEIERNKIEKRLRVEQSNNVYKSYVLICSILIVLISLLTFYTWSKNIVAEEDPWIPGRPSFFFTFHDEFVGRDWLKQKIRDNLNKTTAGLILVAEPGYGKSALIANFIKTYEDNGNLPLLGYHICQYDSRSSLDVSNFIINLWRDLRKRYHDFDYKTPARFKEFKDIKTYCTFDPSQCFQELIANPLNSANLSKRSLFIVDAIDECQTSPLGMEAISIPDLLLKQHKLLQPILSIFMTSRNNSELLSLFRSFKKIQIEQNSNENKDDLKLLIRRHTRCTDSYVDRLLEETSHNFLILRYYLSDIHETCRLDQVQNIRSIFEMHDKRFLRIYGDGFSRKYRVDRSFFEVLCSQFIEESITIHSMRNILNYYFPRPDDDEFEEMMRRLTTNIIRLSNKHEIIVPHSSLFNWLISDENLKFRVNVQRGHFAWTNYLYNKLKTITKQPPLPAYHSLIDRLYSLARHFIAAGNDSLQNELDSGKFKIVDFRITCGSCWKYVLPFSNIDNGTLSHIGHAVSIVDDYDFIKTLTLLSRTNDWTKEAFIAYTRYHRYSFSALTQSGTVDLKQKHVVVDTWLTFGYYCMPGIEGDVNGDELFGIGNITRRQLLLNFLGNFSVDYVSIFHSTIMHFDIDRIKMLVSHDKLLLDETTGNGWDVFDTVVSFDNLDLLNELKNYKTMEKNVWYLWYAAVHGSTSIVEYLLNQGIQDECVKCRWRTLDEYPTNLTTFAQKYKFRRHFLCESALMVAVKRGHHEVVSALLLHDTKCLEFKDAFGFSPLAAAIYYRHETVIKRLLHHGANVNFVVKTLLNASVVDFFNRVLRFPLEKKWNTQSSYNGATIFHLSALKPTCLSTKLLLKILHKRTNSNLDIKDNHGHSPLYYATCHPDADKTYTYLEDFLQPKSHRMVFLLIEAFHSQQISDSLLLQLGICGRKKQHQSEMSIVSKYKDRFCKQENYFPALKEFSSIVEAKAASELNTIPSILFSSIRQKLMSPDCMVFIFHQLPLTISNSKEIIKYIKDEYGVNAHIYIKAFPAPDHGISVRYSDCSAITETE